VQDNLPDKLLLVQAEASTLQQIFLNLIINARDAVMSATERRITLSGAAEDDHVWVDIADTGPGIAPDLLGRIFDPFFSTKPPGQGTGLGLSVSSSIVAGFGGTLSVQATGAEGSRFRVSLPRPGHARRCATGMSTAALEGPRSGIGTGCTPGAIERLQARSNALRSGIQLVVIGIAKALLRLVPHDVDDAEGDGQQHTEYP
jgi:hypothetical protein